MTLMAGASTLCLYPLPFPVHVPQGFERFGMIDANGCPPPITPDEVARIILGNRTDEFERLRGVPGFQLEPVPWDIVKQLVAENTTESLGKLGRSPAGQVIYWRFKSKVGPRAGLFAGLACTTGHTYYEFAGTVQQSRSTSRAQGVTLVACQVYTFLRKGIMVAGSVACFAWRFISCRSQLMKRSSAPCRLTKSGQV